MRGEGNDYGIKNPDGVTQNPLNERRISYANDGSRFVSETPLAGQNELTVTAETSDVTASVQPSASFGASQTTLSVDPTSYTATSVSSSASTSTAATTAASSAASGAATTAATASAATAATTATASGAATLVAATGTGIGAAAGAIAATVATAALVVAAFVSTLVINLTLLLAGMHSLVFQVQMTGAQDEDFETPIYAIISDGDKIVQQRQIERDTLVLSFDGLEPRTEYTVVVKNETKTFFEKTYITAGEEKEPRGFLRVWNEDNEIFVTVEGMILGDTERYTVTAKDENGKTVFAKDGVDEFAEYVFTLDKPRKLFFTLTVGGRITAVEEIEVQPVHDPAGIDWIWAEDFRSASAVIPGTDGGEPLYLEATVTEEFFGETDCETGGSVRYVATVFFDGEEYSDERTEEIAAPGHDWGEPTFEWTPDGLGGYSGATALFVCSRNFEHRETIEATLTVEQIESGCEDACTRYVASVTAEWNGETYTDEMTVVQEGTALGHEFLDPYEDPPDDDAFGLVYDPDTDGIESATLTLTCQCCQTAVTMQASEIGVSPKTSGDNLCENGGVGVYYLFWDAYGLEYSKYVEAEVKPIGHDYYEPSFRWDEGGEDAAPSATAVFTCKHDCGTTVEIRATLEGPEESDATCENDAYAVYIATVEAEWASEPYVEVRPIRRVGTALGHDTPDPDSLSDEELGELIRVKQDETGAIVSADIALTCARCGETVLLGASEIELMSSEDDLCVEGGSAEYYLFWGENGMERSFYRTVTVDPLGHDPDYDEAHFEWTDDHTATLLVPCVRFGCEHVETVEASVTDVEQSPDCENEGYVRYEAIAYAGGLEFTDEQTVTLTALGHDYTDAEATFRFENDDLTGEVVSATALIPCTRAGCAHVEEIAADEITSETSDNVCEYEGNVTYHATLNWNDAVYEDETTVPVGPLGHDWGEPEFEWTLNQDGFYNEDGATLVVTCLRDHSHVERVTASVVAAEESTEPSCTVGSITDYVATAVWNDEEYTDAKPVEWKDTILGHQFPNLYEDEPGDDAFTISYDPETNAVVAATMTLTCQRCLETVVLDADEITLMTSDINYCVDGGAAEYYLFWSNPEYSRYVNVEVEPLEHVWSEPVFEWEMDEDETEYIGATASFSCERDPSHTDSVSATLGDPEPHPATCEDDAYTVYSASVEHEGKTYTDSRTVTEYETATGHEYPEPDPNGDVEGVTIAWTQNEKGEIVSATMTRICAVCGGEETLYADEITLMSSDIDYCNEGGEAEYYLFWDGEMEFAKYVTVEVDPLGHDFNFDEAWFDWTEDTVNGGYSGATLYITCKRDGEHVEPFEATVTEEETRYVASVTAYGREFQDEREKDPTGSGG